MQRISFLGTGAMGSRMAKNLFDAGYEVTVWNRTQDKAQHLFDMGINKAPSPKEAATDADLVISMVRDVEASRYIWLDEELGALRSMKKDAIGIECSTLSLPYINELSTLFCEQGISFLDAPVAGSRPQAEAGKLIFFVGGNVQTVQAVCPILELMGMSVYHAGGHGSGTIIKLMVNGLFGAQLAVLSELMGFAARTQIDLAKAVRILQDTPVCSPATANAATAMLNHAYEPAFPIELVDKDFQLIEKSVAAINSKAPICDATKNLYSQAIQGGYGRDNITGVYQLYCDFAG